MKKITLFALFAFTLFSCQSGERGNGIFVEENRSLSYFNTVNLEGSGDIYLSQDSVEKITIITDENIINLIETNVRSNRLTIRPSRSISPTKLQYYISMRDPSKFEIEGSCNLKNLTKIKSNSLSIYIEGSGDIDIDDMEVNLTALSIEGSGNVYFRGISEISTVIIEGTGTVDQVELESNDVTATIEGSGLIRVWAKDRLFARIYGSGSILYKGDPTDLNTGISGTGEIKRIP